MSKEFNNIDELFQTVFENESAEVPALVKSNIDRKIAAGGKRGYGFMITATLLVLMVSAGIAFYPGDETPGTVAGNQAEPQNKESITGTNDNAHERGNQNAAFTDDASGRTDQLIPENNITGEGSGPAQNLNKEMGPQTENSYSWPMGGQVVAGSFSSATEQNQGEGERESGSESESENGNENESGSERENGNEGENGNENMDGLAGTADDMISPTPLPGRDQGDGIERVIGDSTANHVTGSGNDGMVVPDSAANDQLTEELPEPSETVDPGEPKYNPWMIGLGGGLNLVKSNYSAASQDEQQFYTDATNDAPGSSVYFEARYRLNNSLTFGSGLGLTRMVENYYFYKTTTDYNETITWNYIYDTTDTSGIFNPIDSSAVYHTDTITTVDYNQTGATRAAYLNIPVSVGTQIIRNKFRFDLYLTARFNYLISASGGYISNDAFVAFEKDNSIFKTWYLDMLLGGAVHYNLVSGLYLSGNFAYRPAIGQLYQNTSFNRALQYTHLGIGLNWKF